MTKEILGLPGWTPSPLYRKIYKEVAEIDQELTSLIHQWHLLKTNLPMSIKKFDGTPINFKGIAFKGSVVDVFWKDFIEPYLENYSVRVLEHTSSLALHCGCSVNESVEEAKSLLLVMVRRIYEVMAETDSLLRGDGITIPEKKNVTSRISHMSHIISEHADIEKMKKKPSEGHVFNIENLQGVNIQLGSNNNMNNIDIDKSTEDNYKG